MLKVRDIEKTDRCLECVIYRSNISTPPMKIGSCESCLIYSVDGKDMWRIYDEIRKDRDQSN